MSEQCKKCLLYEAGEKVTYNEVMNYVATLNPEDMVTSQEYEKRISSCRKCENLISGMCLKCGCYVEVRARLKKMNCPNYDNRMW